MNIILSDVFFLGHFDFTAKIIPPDRKKIEYSKNDNMSSIAPYPYNVSNGSRT